VATVAPKRASRVISTVLVTVSSVATRVQAARLYVSVTVPEYFRSVDPIGQSVYVAFLSLAVHVSDTAEDPQVVRDTVEVAFSAMTAAERAPIPVLTASSASSSVPVFFAQPVKAKLKATKHKIFDMGPPFDSK